MKAVQTGVFGILVIAVGILAAVAQAASATGTITESSAGNVRIGMTIAEVRKRSHR